MNRVIASASAAMLLLLVAPADLASAAEGPAVRDLPGVRIVPDEGLVEGQIVRVVGVGFTVGATVAVLECNTGATTSADCDLSRIAFVTAGDNDNHHLAGGTFRIRFGVTRFITTENGGLRECLPGQCILVASNVADVAESAGVPLDFAP